MRFRTALGALAFAAMAWPQGSSQEYQVYTEHPRLFLNAQRLRRLKRERERQSPRWQQFQALMAGKAQMPEPGFALALYSQVTGDPEPCRRAAEWSLGPANDLRQLALVFDWCQAALSETQSRALADKIRGAAEASRRAMGIPAVRSRLLAALALAGHAPGFPEQQIRWGFEQWWRGTMVPALRAGRDAAPREDFYPLFEILHAIRDNLNEDLRELAPAFFKTLPIYQLISYYPASFPAAENEYRIPAAKNLAEVDLRRAALARAADLAMVAYDPNAQETQFVQGWLTHDRFMLAGAFGAVYEFLWANPYQPGLSYYNVPLVFYDPAFGRLFLRSSWNDDALWLGYFNNQLQVFEKGEPKIVRPGSAAGPFRVGEAVVLAAPARFSIQPRDPATFFLLGLKPRQRYEIEVDDEELREVKSDNGGILRLEFAPETAAGVRLRGVAAKPEPL